MKGVITSIICEFDTFYLGAKLEIIIDDIPYLTVKYDRNNISNKVFITLPTRIRVYEKLVIKGKSSEDECINFKDLSVITLKGLRRRKYRQPPIVEITS